MCVKEYEFIDPLDGPLGGVLKDWFRWHPNRASRLISALEEFAERDCDLSCIVTERNRRGREIYMEPPRYVLGPVPDAACLIRVDHARSAIEIVQLLEEYGGVGESKQWSDVVALAVGLI